MLNLTGSKLEHIAISHNRILQNQEKNETVETNDEINKILGNPFDDSVKEIKSTTGVKTTIVTCQDGEQIEMPQSWAPESMVNNILSHNRINSVTNVLLIGSTGSGKSTTAKRIIHGLHTKHPSYIILWFSRHDIMNFKKVLEKIPKGRDVILVFDDISFLSDLMTKTELAEMGNDMATIRHTYLGESSKMITFNMIHYSKSFSKSSHARSSHFTIATSLTGNEMANFEEIFGNKWVLKNFAQIYRNSVLKGRFGYMLDGHSEKMQYYNTEKFHPCLINEINHSHLMLVDKIDCQICGMDIYTDEKNMPATSEEEFVEMLRYPETHVRKALKWYSFMRTGNLMLLPPHDRKIFRHITKLAQHVNLDFKKICEIADSKKKYHTSFNKRTKELDEEIDKGIDKIIKSV